MSKQSTLADKLAGKIFGTGFFQQQWATRAETFGAIMEPAFPDDPKSRIRVLSIFSLIDRHQFARAYRKLAELQRLARQSGKAEQALTDFLYGLCSEVAGDEQQMLTGYLRCTEMEPAYHVPYIKVAKAMLDRAQYESAAAYFQQGISTLQRMQQTDKTRYSLASAKGNMALALTMMHGYEDAREQLDEALTSPAHRHAFHSIEALLAAATGDAENARRHLALLGEASPDRQADNQELVDRILAGKHPHFTVIPVEDEAVAAFWAWFRTQESHLSGLTRQDSPGPLIAALTEQLTPVFPFEERPLHIAAEKRGDQVRIIIDDYCSRSLHSGLVTLTEACPADIRSRWEFII